MGRTNQTTKLKNKLKNKTQSDLEMYSDQLKETYNYAYQLFIQNPNPPQPDKDIKYLNNLHNKIHLSNEILNSRRTRNNN